MQSFKAREKARRYVMQALYGWHIAGGEIAAIEAFYRADRNPRNYDLDYFLRLLHEIPRLQDELAADLGPFLDRPYKSLDPIELSIVQIAAYEFKFCFDIPFKVVINEAVELAKMFGAQDSHTFINKVLDKMARVSRAHELCASVA